MLWLTTPYQTTPPYVCHSLASFRHRCYVSGLRLKNKSPPSVDEGAQYAAKERTSPPPRCTSQTVATMEWLRVLLLVLASTWATGLTSDADLNVVNANHIFNEIRDAMRQFGNSLNHNGMSIFLATIPKDTELYHGTSHPWRVNGTEWLAFEPEHAYVFAHGPMTKPPDDGDEEARFVPPRQRAQLQALLGDGRTSDSSPQPPWLLEPGYLHTYRAKHDLRLLYVNGQSAAKSSKGTLDVQDYVLLPEPPSRIPGEWLPFDDLARARSLCQVARTEWLGRIDGILRMEAGFEVVLCDFEKDLDLLSAVQSNDKERDSWDVSWEEVFNYYKAVAARYDGIGGGRVQLDYDRLVTMYHHPGAMYFDQKGLPRVDNSSTSISGLRDKVRELATGDTDSTGMNWQAATDMVVARYADRIAYLTSASFPNLTSFQGEVERALRPFIDYSARNSRVEILRCSQLSLPHHDTESLASRSILNITTTICSTLSSILSDDIDLSSAVDRITELQSWLQWTEWKKCRGCGYHELCFLPIWPLGTEEDFERPKCRSEIVQTPGGYWWDDFELLRGKGVAPHMIDGCYW